MKRKETISIIYIADLHEANKELRYLFKRTKGDLYLVGGDLLYRAFYSYDTISEFITLQEKYYDYALQRGLKTSPYDLSHMFLDENRDQEWVKNSQRYLELYARAMKNMKEKYQILENIFLTYSRVPVYILPGNYDLEPGETALGKRHLHKKSIYFEDYKISGFGGADVFTPGIPEKWTVKYNDGKIKKNELGENYYFFKREAPDIMMIHKPVYGHFDRLSSYGNIGSFSLASLVEEKNPVSLVLSGHVHHDAGIKKSDGIVYLNPGPLGKTIQPVGFSRGGFFSEIILDKELTKHGPKNCVRRIRRFAITKGRIKQIEEKIFPPPDYMDKFSLFEDIKFFFRKFETHDAKIKVKSLINIARKIQKGGEQVAFDLLGSVAFGMSESKSDVDLVIYHMCPKDWVCDLDKCQKSRYYQDLLLKNLLHEVSNNHYKFEVIDCINIHLILNAVKNNDHQDDSLIRYIFYRKVGRGVNKRFLRSIDNYIKESHELQKKVYEVINDLMLSFSSTSSQKYSFEKYRERLTEMGINLPESIQLKIFTYLGFK